MKFRWPKVAPNQRIITEDFDRLARQAEDLSAWILQHVGIDATDPLSAPRGIVCWGLRTTFSAGLARVSAGAALLPSTNADRKFRLVSSDSTIEVEIPTPVGSSRNDLLQLRLDPDVNDATSLEEREFRRVNDGGAEEVYSDSVYTYRQPTAVVERLEDVGDNYTPSAGCVRLALVTIDEGGFGSIFDLRSFLYPAPAGGWDSSAPESGKYWRGVRSAIVRLGTAISGLADKTGKLKGSVAVADGGPAIETSAVGGGAFGFASDRRFFGRSFAADQTVEAKRVDLTNASGEGDSPVSTGWSLWKGNIIRAQLVVRVTLDEADGETITGWEWCGAGIQSVTREDIGQWLVALTAGVGGASAVSDGKLAVVPLVGLATPGLPGGAHAVEGTLFGGQGDPRFTDLLADEDGLHIRTWQSVNTGGAAAPFHRRDRSFAVLFVGPVGVTGAEWTEGAL